MSKNIGECIAQYALKRDDLDTKRKEFKTLEKELKMELIELEVEILDAQREIGLTSVSNSTHTAFQTTKKFVRIGDWDEFSQYVMESGNLQLLEKRVAKLAALELFEVEGIDPSEIGLNKEEEITIQVRKR